MSKLISLFVHDLGNNPIGRAIPISKALQKAGYETEILGFLIDGDEKVYEPYKNEVNPKIIETSTKTIEMFLNIRQLALSAEGDIVYAFKPLMTTLAPAYYAARIDKHRPILLDVEDEDIYAKLPTDGNNKKKSKNKSYKSRAFSGAKKIMSSKHKWKRILTGWLEGNSGNYTRLLQIVRNNVDDVTVVSSALKKRYGGKILRHGPDERIFNPNREFGEGNVLKDKWNVPENKYLAMFIGTPRSHKGLKVLAEALSKPCCSNWEFVHVGPVKSKYVQMFDHADTAGHFLGPQVYEDAPELLSLADAVPIPQRDSLNARAQVPAKLMDAMAMAKPIVASRVGDIPQILGEGERGWIVEPEKPEALAKALEDISTHQRKAEEKSRRARKWYKRNASTDALSGKLKKIITAVE